MYIYICVCVMFLYEHDNFRVSSMQKNTSAPSFPGAWRRSRTGTVLGGCRMVLPPSDKLVYKPHELVRYINHTAIEFSHFDISTGGPIL